MRKTCLTILSIFIISLIFNKVAFAETSYDCNINAFIDISDTENPKITESIHLVNKSDKYIIDELNFRYPYSIYGVEAFIGDEKLNVEENQNSININMFRYYLIPNGEKDLKISYFSKDLFKLRGGISSFYLPEFEYCNGKESTFQLKLPISSNDLEYINVPSFEIVDENTISFTHNKDVYVSWGKSKDYVVNAELLINYGTFIPIPSGTFSDTRVYEIPSSAVFFKDRLNNEFLNVTAGLDYLSKYSIGVSSKNPILNNYAGISGFIDNTDAFKLSEKPSIKEIYNAVLDKYNPVLKRGSSSLKTIPEIVLKEEQEASEYSYTFLNLLEKYGYKAQMYYGLLQLPISEEIVWHYWVGVYDDSLGEVLQYDPFMEDLMGYYSFEKVTNHRYVWGIYNIDIKFLPEAIHNIKNSKELITFTDNSKSGEVKGASMLLSAFLNKPQDLSKKTELVIKNEGNEVVYISKILLNGEYDITGSHSNVGVLPKTAKIISFEKDIPGELLVKSFGDINARVDFINDNGSISLETNRVKVYAYIIYIAFFVSLYIFLVGIIFLIRKNFNYIKKYFYSLSRK